MLKKYLVMDIGGTAIKYCIMDKTAKIIEINEQDSKIEKEEFFNCLDNIIQAYINEISGIAISFPGRIDVNEGVAHSGGNFSWVKDLPLKSILEEKYCKKVWIENDGKCSALGELWKGNLSNVENGVVICLGTGIGGGIILNGNLYRGINGSAGEFSSILENFENPMNVKNFSRIGSYKSLVNIYTEKKGTASKDYNGREFFECYENGDKIAKSALRDYVKIISTGIINIQAILDVEKICIGGGISAQDVLVNQIKKTVHNFFIKKANKAIKEPIIEKCYFENSAGCVGALYNFLNMEKLL